MRYWGYIGVFILWLSSSILQAQAPAVPSDACFLSAAWNLPRGTSGHVLSSGGQTRQYMLFLPSHYNGTDPLPMVVSYHGFASTAKQHMAWTEWNDLAEVENFIVVYPQASEFPARWYMGVNPLTPQDNQRDQIFTADLLEMLKSTYCIDTARIYATGFSAGGGMVYRLACEMADQWAAVATVSGAYGVLPAGCHPARPLPILSIHGDADPIVPYTGGRGFPAVEDWIQTWAGQNACAPYPTVANYVQDVIVREYYGCADQVTVRLYTVRGEGHSWAGSEVAQKALFMGNPSQAIDTTAELWAFFQQYTLPSMPATLVALAPPHPPKPNFPSLIQVVTRQRMAPLLRQRGVRE